MRYLRNRFERVTHLALRALTANINEAPEVIKSIKNKVNSKVKERHLGFNSLCFVLHSCAG